MLQWNNACLSVCLSICQSECECVEWGWSVCYQCLIMCHYLHNEINNASKWPNVFRFFLCVCVCRCRKLYQCVCVSMTIRVYFYFVFRFLFLWNLFSFSYFFFFVTFSVCLANILMAISCPFDYVGYIASVGIDDMTVVCVSIDLFIHSFIHLSSLYYIFILYLMNICTNICYFSLACFNWRFFFLFLFFVLFVYCQSSVCCSLVLSINIPKLGIYFNSWMNSRIFISKFKKIWLLNSNFKVCKQKKFTIESSRLCVLY